MAVEDTEVVATEAEATVAEAMVEAMVVEVTAEEATAEEATAEEATAEATEEEEVMERCTQQATVGTLSRRRTAEWDTAVEATTNLKAMENHRMEAATPVVEDTVEVMADMAEVMEAMAVEVMEDANTTVPRATKLTFINVSLLEK